MNYSYRPNRDECDVIIAALARCYPACFFENPKLRRPLKKDILADLHAAGFPFTAEETAAAVKWYESHFTYQYALQAGAKRVDLTGREAGTVTPAEQRSALVYIETRKREMQAREVLPAFVHTPVRAVGDDASRSVTTQPVAPPPPPLNLSLSSARTVDAGKDDGKGNKKKPGRFSPPCPACGAPGHVIPRSTQVEGGTVVRVRLCAGAVPHVFMTKETAIPT